MGAFEDPRLDHHGAAEAGEGCRRGGEVARNREPGHRDAGGLQRPCGEQVVVGEGHRGRVGHDDPHVLGESGAGRGQDRELHGEGRNDDVDGFPVHHPAQVQDHVRVRRRQEPDRGGGSLPGLAGVGAGVGAEVREAPGFELGRDGPPGGACNPGNEYARAHDCSIPPSPAGPRLQLRPFQPPIPRQLVDGQTSRFRDCSIHTLLESPAAPADSSDLIPPVDGETSRADTSGLYPKLEPATTRPGRGPVTEHDDGGGAGRRRRCYVFGE